MEGADVRLFFTSRGTAYVTLVTIERKHDGNSGTLRCIANPLILGLHSDLFTSKAAEGFPRDLQSCPYFGSL